LPEFYDDIYKNSEKNKKIFTKQLSARLNKIYNKNDYKFKSQKIKNNWRKIEEEFFAILSNFNL